MKCKECGRQIPDGALFCKYCGAAANAGGEDTGTNGRRLDFEKKQKGVRRGAAKKRGNGLIIGLAAVLIVPRHKTPAGALVIPAVFSLLSFRRFDPETGCIWLILTALSLWAFRADWKG